MMQKIKNLFAVLGWLMPVLGLAQRIDNTASFRQIDQAQYVRLHYDNDYFTATDLYYTQGYNFEVVHPKLRKNPLTRLLITTNRNQAKYGLAFEHFGFTPTTIQSDAILVGDRPFAGAMLLKTFSMSADTVRRLRIASVLSTGLVGPGAFGGEMQTAIHRAINGVTPQGWQHQIRNDVIVNYNLTIEKQLYAYRNALSVSANAMVQAGTFVNRLQTGFVVMAGRFNSPFGNSSKIGRSGLQLYGYAQPLVSLVGYDATLQGGLFNRDSPYIIPADQLMRTTFQTNFGAVLKYKKMYLEYYQSVLTKEFATGMSHRWGGVKVGVAGLSN
jgi:lipid A 3-O-deacylase